MSLRDDLRVLIDACTTGIWIQTAEPMEAQAEIVQLVNNRREEVPVQEGAWSCYSWDIATGVKKLLERRDSFALPAGPKSPQGAIEALRALNQSGEGPHLLLIHNFHKFLHLPDVMQGLANELQAGKQSGTFGIVLSPVTQIPVELRTYFTPLHHGLPDRQELETLVRELYPEATEGRDIPHTLLDAAAGLTRYEAENAYAVAYAREGKLSSRPVWEYKAQTLSKGGVISLYKGSEGFDTLGGLEAIKSFCRKALEPRSSRRSVAKGVVALGVPGAGKSAFAKALGVESNRPTAVVDIGGLLSKYVGESEANLKQVLNTLEAMSPCIAFLDEIEKGLSGVGSGLDSGVMDRIFGTLLSWRQDTKADVFLVATSNDISKMPAPLIRAGRTNAIFFFDLPTRSEKDAIWGMYLKQYGIDQGNQPLPDDTEWTGAEIRNTCELADLLGVDLAEAARMTVPIATTSAGQISELRTWAEGRVLSASCSGVYHSMKNADKKPQKRRNIKSSGESLN